VAACAHIKPNGGRCRARPMRGELWCYAHHPDLADERRGASRRGGRRGGRGRPVAVLGKLDRQLQDLAADTLEGKVERGVAAVVNQILNSRVRIIELERRLREGELEERLETLERTVAELVEAGEAARSWGS
jgi:hypothetical protein